MAVLLACLASLAFLVPAAFASDSGATDSPSGGDQSTVVADPGASDPAVATPVTSDPGATDPAPSDPAAGDPAPVTDPAPADPAPADPAPVDPAPVDPPPVAIDPPPELPVVGPGSSTVIPDPTASDPVTPTIDLPPVGTTPIATPVSKGPGDTTGTGTHSGHVDAPAPAPAATSFPAAPAFSAPVIPPQATAPPADNSNGVVLTPVERAPAAWRWPRAAGHDSPHSATALAAPFLSSAPPLAMTAGPVPSEAALAGAHHNAQRGAENVLSAVPTLGGPGLPAAPASAGSAAPGGVGGIGGGLWLASLLFLLLAFAAPRRAITGPVTAPALGLRPVFVPARAPPAI